MPYPDDRVPPFGAASKGGPIAWPSSPQVLRDMTRCPACFTPLGSARCGRCGLDVTHPDVVEVATASLAAADALDRRAELIGRMRSQPAYPAVSERGSVAPEPVSPTPVSTAPVSAASITSPGIPAPSIPAPSIPAPSIPAPSFPAPSVASPSTVSAGTASPSVASADPAPEDAASPGSAKPRHSSVQVGLLIAGVSLLSVFAIFFLVYAFISFGLLWRSLIIAGATAATIAGASLLARRRLRASAEGVAAFAVVLLYLDAYGARANDLLGLGGGGTAQYWGGALLVLGVALVAWSRLSGLRVPSIAGWLSVPPGAGLLAGAVTDALAMESRLFVGFAAAAFAALVCATFLGDARPAPVPGDLAQSGSVAADRRPGWLAESMTVLTVGVVAVLGSMASALVLLPAEEWGGTVGFLITAVLAAGFAAHCASRSDQTIASGFGPLFAALAAATAAWSVAVAAVRMGLFEPGVALVGPPAMAAVVALVVEAARRGRPRGPVRLSLGVALWTATAVTVCTLIPAVGVLLTALVPAVLRAASPWTIGATDALAAMPEGAPSAVLAFAVVGAAAAVAWAGGDRLRARGVLLAGWGIGVAVVATLLLETLWTVMAGWAVIGILSLVALRRISARAVADGRRSPAGWRLLGAAAVTVATALVFAAGWASRETWMFGVVFAIGMLLAARTLIPRGGTADADAGAGLLAGATLVALVGVGTTVAHLTWPGVTGATLRLDVAVMVALAAIVLLAATTVTPRAPLRTGLHSRADRRAVCGVAAVTTTLAVTTWWWLLAGAAAPAREALLPQFGTSMMAGVILLAVVLLANREAVVGGRLATVASGVAIAPAVLWLLDSVARLVDSRALLGLTPALAFLLLAVVILVLRLRGPAGLGGTAREAGLALVGVPALWSALDGQPRYGWLSLLLVAIGMLTVAVPNHGVLPSPTPRRHWVWPALLLGVAGVWSRLDGGGARDGLSTEVVVLPVAAALLLGAAVLHLRGRRADATRPESGSDTKAPDPGAVLVFFALLVGVLPLAADVTTGGLWRAVIVFAVAAGLLLWGSLRRGPAASRFGDAAAVAGGLGVLVIFLTRASSASRFTAEVDLWLAAGCAVLLGAALLQAHASDARRKRTAELLVLVPLISVLAIGGAALRSADFGLMRAMAMLMFFGAVHVLAMLLERSPFTRRIGWVAIAAAAFTAALAAAAEVAPAVEILTVPLAAALLAGGTVHLAEHPAARSWPWLGPGLAVLLLPSFVEATQSPEQWRLLALGLVAVAVAVIGSLRRLQAAFVLGIVIGVAHGLAALAPQIRAVYESQPWWMWAGLAGVVLVVLAIRYEQRLRSFRTVVMRIAALR